MSVFGNRWAAALLVCVFLGTSRFTDFQTQLGAPPTSLAGRLQTFRANGVLSASRQAGQAHARYQLTEKGRAFFPVIVTALQCGQQWFHAPEGPAVMITHLGCGDPFIGEFELRPMRSAPEGRAGQRGLVRSAGRAATMPTPTPNTAPRPPRRRRRRKGRRPPTPGA